MNREDSRCCRTSNSLVGLGGVWLCWHRGKELRLWNHLHVGMLNLQREWWIHTHHMVLQLKAHMIVEICNGVGTSSSH